MIISESKPSKFWQGWRDNDYVSWQILLVYLKIYAMENSLECINQ